MGVLATAAVFVWSGALTVVDIRHRRLPNVLTLTGAAVILAVAAATGRGGPALLGAVTLSGLYLLVHLANPHGLGGGDVKLALGTGALTGALGPDVWVLAALGAPLLTAVVGTSVAVSGRGRTVPHGPAMCAATLLAAALVL